MTPRHVSLFACSWILTAGSVLAQLQVGWQVVAPSSNASAVAVDSTGQAWTSELVYVGADNPKPVVHRYATTGAVLATYTGSALTGYSGQQVAFAVDPAGQYATLAIRELFGERIVRIDAAGSEAWSNTTWNVPTLGARGLVPTLLVDAAGNSYVLGTASVVGTGVDVLVVSFDANGAWRWSRTIDGGGSLTDTPTDFALDGSGGLFVVGSWDSTSSTAPEFGQFGTMHLDGLGNVLWTRTFAGAGGGGMATSVATDGAGNVNVAGTSSSRTEALLRSYDSLGNVRWTHAYSIGIGALYDDVAVDAQGAVFATGMQFVSGGPVLVGDILTAKHDASGALVWRTVTDSGPAGGDRGSRIFVDSLGRSTVVGWRYDNSLHVVAQRYERDGSQRWRSIFSTLSSDVWSGASASRDGTVYLASTASQGPQWIPNGVVRQLLDQSTLVCVGDGSDGACPCGNTSDIGLSQGCRNSAGTGARLVDTGVASVSGDTLRLSVSGTTPTGTCVFVQGNTTLAAIPFGDGLRCVGGTERRLATLVAAGGASAIPGVGEPSISQRAAAQGDVLQVGVTRTYQVFYRDSDPTFCASPQGGAFDMSSGLRITWAP